MHISQKTKIPLSSFYNMQKEKDINLLENINLIEAKDDMLVLDYSQLFENISLVGSVGAYIFYKTPEQIKEIQELCSKNSVAFINQYLYFDMHYFKENILFIDKAWDEESEYLLKNNVDEFINKLKKRVEELRKIEELKAENQKLNKSLYNITIDTQIGEMNDKINKINHTRFFCDYQKQKSNNSNEKQV